MSNHLLDLPTIQMEKSTNFSTLFINGKFLTQSVTGVQRYSYELLNTLDEMIESQEINLRLKNIICLVPKSVKKLPSWKHIEIRKVGFFQGNIWEQFCLPFYVKNGLLFSPANIGPYFVKNQVVTMHDASVCAVPEAYSTAFKLKYKIIMKRLGKTAKSIITVSEFSKSELIKYFKIHPTRINVILLGSEHIQRIVPDPNIIKSRNLDTKPFFLSVGSNSPHKNVKIIYEAMNYFTNPEFNVVIAGGSNNLVFNDLEFHNKENIIALGYVSDAELRTLYENAIGYIFPSKYEGFGLPILEALSFGCPVISSNSASLPEVGLNNVEYFDPSDAKFLADKMKDLQKFQGKRINPEVISNFSWKNTVKEFVKLINNLNDSSNN